MKLKHIPDKTPNWDFSHSHNNHLHPDKDKPNIILIIADDLGINDISGRTDISTPYIDSIAENGVNFVNAYAGHATCSPSRASIMIGKFPSRFGFEFTPVPPSFSYLVTRPYPFSGGRSGIFHSDKVEFVPEMADMVVPRS